ncbi:hypothetical protein HYDPIDRAFT_92068 [Hydnomerulius pinastri MD-312]|uniref:FAD-binding domain-containing protein n=1 Tax=Hydnomerulius pinastri MD-312 TaxID=994086 RepID=A0A0C9WE44_9AGAM|nr:hypothetical protein HYDPIDRAFT_92068 [Hydnomerulius pinastri MD-312]
MASHSSPTKPKFRVAIWYVAPIYVPGPALTRIPPSGGGVGGLILATTIGKYDPSIPIDLYEAHDSITTTGAGITIWRRTHEIMTELGLFNDIKGTFTKPPESSHGPYFRRSDIPEGGYEWFHQRFRYGPSQMHRQEMIAIMEKHLPASCTVHFKKRLVSYAEPRSEALPITLNFADGSTATTDVLLGADGIRSAVRKTMLELASDDNKAGEDLRQYIDATWTGMLVYRGIFPAEDLRKLDPENLCLTEMVVVICFQSIVTYPVANGTLVNFAAIIADPSLKGTPYEGHWVSDTTNEELVNAFEDFEPGARALFQCCKTPSRWALHVLKKLPLCARGRVTIIGDACHAMTPHFGAGAGQAIEDAFVLGRLLAHPLTTLSRVQDALSIYQDIRLPFSTSVASNSFEMGWLYIFMDPGHYDGTRQEGDLDERGISAHERAGMEKLKQTMLEKWEWMEKGGAIEEWGEAELRLKEKAGI